MLYVIPLILLEEDAFKLPFDTLRMLASNCSGEIILKSVKKYLNNPNANPQCKELINKVYAQEFLIRDFLEREDVNYRVQYLHQLRFEDITADLTKDTLNEIKESIEMLLYDENSLPYLEPVTKDDMQRLYSHIEGKLAQLCLDYPDEKMTQDIKDKFDALQRLRADIRANERLFKDTRKYAKGTILRPIFRERKKYNIILRGVTFLLNNQNKNPSSWRYL